MYRNHKNFHIYLYILNNKDEVTVYVNYLVDYHWYGESLNTKNQPSILNGDRENYISLIPLRTGERSDKVNYVT